MTYYWCVSWEWRHNGRNSISNHQPHDYLLNRLFRRRSKKTSNPRVTGLWAGNSPGTGEFPAQMASNAENVSIWWRHRVLQHKSLHAFTPTRSRSGGGAGAKSAPQQMGPTPNFPRPLRNRALQTIFVLKEWQIGLRPHRVCVNIPAVAEQGCQNPPVSALQPLRACVNVALRRLQRRRSFVTLGLHMEYRPAVERKKPPTIN